MIEQLLSTELLQLLSHSLKISFILLLLFLPSHRLLRIELKFLIYNLVFLLISFHLWCFFNLRWLLFIKFITIFIDVGNEVLGLVDSNSVCALELVFEQIVCCQLRRLFNFILGSLACLNFMIVLCLVCIDYLILLIVVYDSVVHF